MRLSKLFRMYVVSIVIFAIAFLVCLFNIFDVATFLNGLERAFQALVGLSVSLIIFPFVTISTVHDVVTEAREIGIPVNKNLVKDYIDACFIVFVLSIIQIVFIIIYSLIHIQYLLYVIFSSLVSMLIVLSFLTIELWQVIKLLYEIK